MDTTLGMVCRMAYMDFKDPESLNKAYELNGTDLGGYNLYVDEAKPRPDNNRDGGFSGGGFSGGRGRGGRSDRGRRGGGRGRGFGGRGGSGGDRGRGGRGTPFRQTAGTASTGKTIASIKNCFARLIWVQLELRLVCPLDLELWLKICRKEDNIW